MPSPDGTEAGPESTNGGDDRRALLVFVHIPKTAGTTMRAVLALNFPGASSRPLANVFKGGGGASYEAVARMREQPPQLKGVRLVRGHVPVGVVTCLEATVKERKSVRPFAYLRDPVDRTLSHFFRIREAQGGHQLPPLAENASLQEALEGGYVHDNLQTRMLCGEAEPFGEMTAELLEQAKRNLSEQLVFFGLTERFDESLVLARRRLGLSTILYQSSGRVNASRPRGTEIPPELIEAAHEANRFDIELYEFASELFAATPELEDLDFQVEVAALRASRTAGDVDLDVPSPDAFKGNKREWRLLLQTQVSLERARFELARRETPRASRRAQQSGLKAKLAAAEKGEREQRRRVAALELELEEVSKNGIGPPARKRKPKQGTTGTRKITAAKRRERNVKAGARDGHGKQGEPGVKPKQGSAKARRDG